MKRFLQHRGFSLIELLVATCIAGIAVTLGLVVYLGSLSSYRREGTSAAVTHSAQMGMEYLARDARAASEILPSYGAYLTSESSIAMKVPAYDASGIIPNAFDYICYEVNGNHELTRTVATAVGLRTIETDRVLAKGVIELSMEYRCLDEFQGNGSTASLQLSHSWQELPSVRVDGIEITEFGVNPGTHTITLSSAPQSGAVVEAVYPIYPTDGAALADTHLVAIEIVCRQADGDEVRTATLSGLTRLRNKR